MTIPHRAFVRCGMCDRRKKSKNKSATEGLAGHIFKKKRSKASFFPQFALSFVIFISGLIQDPFQT